MNHILIRNICHLEKNRNRIILLQLSRDHRGLLTGCRIHLIHSCIESLIRSSRNTILQNLLLNIQLSLHVEAIRNLNINIIYHSLLRIEMIRRRVKGNACRILSVYLDHTVHFHSCIIHEAVIQRPWIPLCISLTQIISTCGQIRIIHASTVLPLNMYRLHIPVRNRRRLIKEKPYIISGICSTDIHEIHGIIINSLKLLGNRQTSILRLICLLSLGKSLHIIFKLLPVLCIRHRNQHRRNPALINRTGLHQQINTLGQRTKEQLSLPISHSCERHDPRTANLIGKNLRSILRIRRSLQIIQIHTCTCKSRCQMEIHHRLCVHICHLIQGKGHTAQRNLLPILRNRQSQ